MAPYAIFGLSRALDKFSSNDEDKQNEAVNTLSAAFLLASLSNSSSCHDENFSYIQYTPITSTTVLQTVPVTDNRTLAGTFDGAVYVRGVPAGGKVQVYNPTYWGNPGGLIENGCGVPIAYSDLICPIDIISVAAAFPAANYGDVSYYDMVFPNAGDYILRFRCWPPSTTPTVWPQVKNLY